MLVSLVFGDQSWNALNESARNIVADRVLFSLTKRQKQ